MINYNVKITGSVQGVNYRGAAKNKAQELNLGGYIRNELDGSVFAEIEGPEDKVLQFIDWCHYGPTQSKVEKVETEPGSIKRYNNFEIKY